MPNVGDIFVCSHCRRESVAKMQRVMDGWTFLGERLICALCGTPVGETPSTDAEGPASTSRRRALDLLGENPVKEPVPLEAEVGHFCKDCAHFLRHPFVCRCLFHNRSTEPMDDCPDFTPAHEEPLGETNVHVQ